VPAKHGRLPPLCSGLSLAHVFSVWMAHEHVNYRYSKTNTGISIVLSVPLLTLKLDEANPTT
jgi:hypothetical protein